MEIRDKHKINDIWELRLVKGDWIIIPKEKLYCPLCGEILVLHDFQASFTAQPDSRFYHIDIRLKCPQCGALFTFGVPVDREVFEKLVYSKYNKKILVSELKDVLEVQDVFKETKQYILEKLKRWGYW